MAFRLSQKAFGQLLRTQSRALGTSSTGRAIARSAPTVACSRSTFVKAFSTSRVALNAEAKASEPRPSRHEQSNPPIPPNRTVFIANLPFFTDKEAFEQLLEEFGPIDTARWMTTATGKAPLCHVTFKNLQDAITLVESSAQEPFYFGGRDLRVDFARHRLQPPADSYPPSHRVYFTQFRGDLLTLRDWLGEHALHVHHAFFASDKVTGEQRDSGVITFGTVEEATAVINELHTKTGPDGMPVYMRYARARPKPEDSEGRSQS